LFSKRKVVIELHKIDNPPLVQHPIEIFVSKRFVRPNPQENKDGDTDAKDRESQSGDAKGVNQLGKITSD
jgi:hypothetical protein